MADIELESKTSGDHLQVRVTASNNELDTTVEIDFSILRELLASTKNRDNQSYSGFTDSANSTVPRIERIRASLLPRHGSDGHSYKILSKSETYSFSLPSEELG